MQINNTPKRFAPLLGTPLFEIGSEEFMATAEVKILNSSGELLGIKRFKNRDNFTVNVAPYFAIPAGVEPADGKSQQVATCQNRMVEVKISVGDGAQNIDSQLMPLLCAKSEPSVGTLLNKMPQPKVIYKNGCEQLDLLVDGQSVDVQIEIISNGSVTETYQWGNLSEQSGVVSILVDAQRIVQLIGGVDQTIMFRFKIFIDDAVQYVDYILINDICQQLSLKWLNEFGAIESYPFELLGVRIRTQESAERSCVLSLASEPEDDQVLRWLSGILSAPKVWIANDEMMTQVKVLTDNVDVQRAKLERFVVDVALPESDCAQTMLTI